MKARLSKAPGRTGLAIPTIIIIGAVLALLALSVLIYREDLDLREGGAAALVAVALALAALLFANRARPASPASTDVSSRLQHVETRLSSLTAPPADTPHDLSDISADVGLLSGLVKNLAEALTAQEREIAELKAKLEQLSSAAKERATQEAAAERAAVVPAPLPPLTAPPSSAILERPVRPQRPADTTPVAAPSSSRVVPSLLPAAELAADSPGRARFEMDSSASEAKRAAIIDALDHERVELHLQPIVSLPQRRTRLYEVLSRLRLADDTLLSPAEFMPTLERLGRLARLDEIVVARALAIATHVATRDSDVRISCNLTPASLRDPALLGKLEAMLALPGILPSRLVFEIQQRSWRALPAEAVASMERLRALGVSFALDRLTDLRFEGITLGEKGVALVKIPADMLLTALMSGDRSNIAAELTAGLARQGVQVVAERIEREGDIPDLIDLDIPLAQGFALGTPRAVRADFGLPRSLQAAPLAEAAVPEPVPAPAPPVAPAKPGEERVPFRAFLRRTG